MSSLAVESHNQDKRGWNFAVLGAGCARTNNGLKSFKGTFGADLVAGPSMILAEFFYKMDGHLRSWFLQGRKKRPPIEFLDVLEVVRVTSWTLDRVKMWYTKAAELSNIFGSSNVESEPEYGKSGQ